MIYYLIFKGKMLDCRSPTPNCKGAYDLVKIKNESRKRNHKRDGIGVGRIRTLPIFSDAAYAPLMI